MPKSLAEKVNDLYDGAATKRLCTVVDNGTDPVFIGQWDTEAIGVGKPTIGQINAAHDAAGFDKADRRASIKAEIATLEAAQARPIREAALGLAGAQDRLAAIDAAIVAKRAELAAV